MMNKLNLLIIYSTLIFQINGQFIGNESNETTPDTTSIETSTITILTTTETPIITTTTTTPETCAVDLSEYMNVTVRESTGFTAVIKYNCTGIDISQLGVFVNESKFDGCNFEENTEENNSIRLNCISIENNAGKNWTFSIIQTNFNEQIVVNQSFTITLSPLSLNSIKNLTIKIDEDISFATIFIENCTSIANLEYLVVQCNVNDSEYEGLSEDCSIICSDIEPGSIYDSSLIRLPIPIFDQFNQTFEEEHRSIPYETELDRVTNLQFNDTSNSISFDCPRGNYDSILLTCFAQDQSCSTNEKTLNLTIEHCSNETSIVSLSSLITQGVSYKCNAFTNKFDFRQVKSDNLTVKTSLQSASLDNPSMFQYLNTTNVSLDLSIHSDYDSIESVCSVDSNTIDQTSNICSNLTITNPPQCSTNIQLKTIRGCNYFCYFTTKKTNYTQKISKNYSVTIYPLKPIVTVTGIASRWVTINWTFSETVSKKAFQLIKEGNVMFTGDTTLSSYNFTDLTVYTNYKLAVILISNRNVSSNLSSVTTLQEAPPIPNAEDTKNKIIPSNQSTTADTHQYPIELDTSLFTASYGPVISYKIYVRQDQTKTSSSLNPIGTYSQAYSNESLDYLALIILISKTEINLRVTKTKMKLLIGNETTCSQQSNATIPCNGQLKSDKTYKLVVSGCTIVGCTNVLSQSFHTQKIPPPPQDEPSSKAWIAVFPVLFVVIIILVLVIWKRRELENCYKSKPVLRRPKDRMSVTFDRQSGTERIQMSLIIEPVRPKYLFQYINLTAEDEKAIYNEYKDLEDMSPTFRQSHIGSEHSAYDRYANISARGPWNHTAVRLVGDDRVHDYINANQIPSYDNKKMYIACQGPIKSTCQDFWDMIVQFQVPTIVMLTKLEERNPHNVAKPLSKCCGYFPMNVNQSMRFGTLTVKVTRIENNSRSDIEIRHILISDNANKSYSLIHYHFTGWPDYNVVEAGRLFDLIEFINDHRKREFSSNPRTKLIESNPTVVHCSAGVGRTGTYIAAETIGRLLRKCPDSELNTMKLDVMGIVFQLRQNRSKMVQTKEQYLLVNRSVEEYLRRTDKLHFIKARSNLPSNAKRISRSQRSSSYYVDIPSERYSQKRSSTVTHVSDASSELSGYSYDHHHQEPPLPPRRTRY